MRRPDLYDLIALAGLGLLGVGLWWVWPPLALMVPGGVLLAVGLAGGLLGSGRRSE